MRYHFAVAALVVVAGCNAERSEGPTVSAEPRHSAQPADPQPLEPNDEVGSSSEENPSLGTVAHVKIGDKERGDDCNARLHFCVFDNGESDFIYVGTRYGMWSDGEFDLTIDGKVVFTGKIERICYEGAVIKMGDVLSEPPKTNIGVHISRVTGWFK